MLLFRQIPNNTAATQQAVGHIRGPTKLQEKYSVYTPGGDVSMFGMEKIPKVLMINTAKNDTNKWEVTLQDSNNTWTWEASPIILGGDDSKSPSFKDRNSYGWLISISPTKDGCKNADGRDVLATLQLYEEEELYGLYHVVQYDPNL